MGYLAMAATPALAVRPLHRSSRRTAAYGSAAVSAVSAASLALSVTAGPAGLWQRVGLGVADVWFAAVAARGLRR